jgi:hypothetical protein
MMKVLPWVIINLVSLVLAIYQGYEYGRRSLQAEWDAEKATAITAQRDKEAALQASMDKLREDKNRETAKLQRTVAALSNSLRDRPERPAVPASANAGDAGGWCSGPQLYREDAALVISESERAEKIRLQLIQCQKMYREASGQ